MNMRPLPVVLLAVLTVLGVLTLGVTGPPFVASVPGPSPDVGAVVPAAGGSVCVTGADAASPRADLLLLAAPEAAADGEEVADADADASRGVVLTLGAEADRRTAGPVAPGGLELLEAGLGADAWLWVGWADRPLVAWQEWRTPGSPGEPRGAVAAACLPTDAPVQSVLGLRTDGGHEALVRLANPFEADATFAITLVTPVGPFEPVALRNVSVPGGSRVTVRINDHLPEQSDIAAVVTVGAGRLAVEGLQRSVAAVGGVEGLAVVSPVTAPSTTWTFPFVQTGPDVEGAVWLLNPEPRAVVVTVTAHTPQGTAVPLVDSIDVGPGALVRVDAADLVPDGSRTAGLTLRSETTGVLAVAGAAFRSDGAEGSGLVRAVGAASPDPEWSLAGLAAPGRETALYVVNLSDEPAPLRVTLTTLPAAPVGMPDDEVDASAQAASSGAAQRVVVLEPGSLAPGASTRVPLPLDGARAFAVVVEGGPALVVSRTTTGRDLLEPITIAATPSRAWRSIDRPLVGRSLAGWVASLRVDG